MKSKFGTICKLAFLSSIAALSLVLIQTGAARSADASDEQMIRKGAEDFVKAFAAGDAESIATMCADECSLTDTEGAHFNGRAEIKQMYVRDFQTFGLQPLTLKITKISFPTADVSIEDGEASFPRTATKTKYNVIHIKKDGAWKMLRITESSYYPAPAEALKGLDWMIGNWTLHGKNKDTFLKVYATNASNFLVLQFSDTEDTSITPTALQIIGWSAKSKDIVSWNFGHDGGFGFGHWRKNDDNWFVETKGITKDGGETVADYKIEHTDNDHFTWQSIGRAINGAKLPNMQNVAATRHRGVRSNMRFQTPVLISVLLLFTAESSQARSVGHTSAPSHGGGGHIHYGSGGHNYGYGGYGGYGYNNGNYGGYYDPNAWGNSGSYGTQGLPPPFMQADPLADYYRQQEINSQMAQQGSATVSSMVLPGQGMMNQTQLPTDFGGAQGQSVSSEPVVSVDEGNAVRENFHGSGIFTSAWWKHYKNAWCNASWSDSWVWNNVDWDTLEAFWRGSAPKSPADYEFGQNITFQDGKVYYGSQPMMTSEEYYHQAQLLASRGASSAPRKGTSAPSAVPPIKDWAQFGVFSLVPSGDKFSTIIFQLAVNRDGQIRGNCYNVMDDQLDVVEGEVDKNNSRVCFTAGKNRSVIYDTGLGNLLSAQSPVLVHLDKVRTQQRALVRLNQSKL